MKLLFEIFHYGEQPTALMLSSTHYVCHLNGSIVFNYQPTSKIFERYLFGNHYAVSQGVQLTYVRQLHVSARTCSQLKRSLEENYNGINPDALDYRTFERLNDLYREGLTFATFQARVKEFSTKKKKEER